MYLLKARFYMYVALHFNTNTLELDMCMLCILYFYYKQNDNLPKTFNMYMQQFVWFAGKFILDKGLM